MASPIISTPVTASIRDNKKRQPIQASARNGSAWKSSARQQAYSSSLLRALRHVSIGSVPPPTRAVREAADRALAAAAKGRTRWSRAVLQTRLRLKFSKARRAGRGSKKPRVGVVRLKPNNATAVRRKARVLGRLVPGCRKEGLPVILEEAADYVAALQMQVRAMTALAHLLSDSAQDINNN